jgi:NDP-sugar pyrophosphorylase family protein
MIQLTDYIEAASLPELVGKLPWQITAEAQPIIETKISQLKASDFVIKGNVAIHKTAVVEEHVILKGPIIIGSHCFVGSHAYLRGGVYLGHHGSVGPGCEVKSSFLFAHCALAHFNFVGDSIVGSNVNMEAGSVICNHFNERTDKSISVWLNNKVVPTWTTKFGALVGDRSRIGANAVLSPGTILSKDSIVRRLSLIEQVR